MMADRIIPIMLVAFKSILFLLDPLATVPSKRLRDDANSRPDSVQFFPVGVRTGRFFRPCQKLG